MNWPMDADGDVFRRLEAKGFDFSVPCSVDYNVDFSAWPPAHEALEWLRAQFGHVEVFPPDPDSDGYVLFQIVGPLTYEGVVSTQHRVTAALQVHGGRCESWGVLH